MVNIPVRYIVSMQDNISQKMSKVQGAVGLLGSTMSQLGGAFTSVGNIMQGFAVGGPMGAAVAAIGEVIAAVSEAVEAFAEFEMAMVNVSSASGLAGDALVQLEEDLVIAAKAAGVEFGVGATKAMEAMEALVKAGLEGAEAVEALNAALAIAKIESISTSEAANMLVGIMGMFAMSADEAAHAADVLVNASITGIGTAAEFGLGLSYVGGRAKELGFSLEEVTAALVALNNQGIKAATAGQSLNMMLIQLVQKSDELGFSIYNSQGEMLSLAEITGNLVDKLNAFSTAEEKNAYLTAIFGSRAGRAAAALVNLGESGDDVREVLENLIIGLDESGTALGIVDQKTDTLMGTQQRLEAMFENMQLTLGEALAPALRFIADIIEKHVVPALNVFFGAIKFISDAIGWWVELFNDITTVIENHFAPAIEGVTSFLAPFAEVVTNIGNALNDFFGGIAEGIDEARQAISDAADEITEDVEFIGHELEHTFNEQHDAMRRWREDWANTANSVGSDTEDMALTVGSAFSDILDALGDLNSEWGSSWGELVDNTNALISQGLLGDAQDAIHDFVNCSTTKQADMVEDIDGYLSDMAKEYRENMLKIGELQAKGQWEEAAMLAKRNEELVAKMDQLEIWRADLIAQSWNNTNDDLRQLLADQYGIVLQGYNDILGLSNMFEPPDISDPVINPIKDLVKELDITHPLPPIYARTDGGGTPIQATINLEFTEPITPLDAREHAEAIQSALNEIQEEQRRSAGL